jgi:hypothetical protein
MKTLSDLSTQINYDSQMAVYAEKINGEFTENSKMRFGQTVFENGGILDNMEFFATNEDIVSTMLDYMDGEEELEYEALQNLICLVNEQNQ